MGKRDEYEILSEDGPDVGLDALKPIFRAIEKEVLDIIEEEAAVAPGESIEPAIRAYCCEGEGGKRMDGVSVVHELTSNRRAERFIPWQEVFGFQCRDDEEFRPNLKKALLKARASINKMLADLGPRLDGTAAGSDQTKSGVFPSEESK